MEKAGFVRHGELRLPPGFRFHPTDEELVVQYLMRKALSYPLPASIIPEFDVCRLDPWDLPGEKERERYFFSIREAKYPNGNRSNRATGSGYWKATGVDKQIVASGKNGVIGMKKTLVFYAGKPPHGSRTDWIMHEYRLFNIAPWQNKLQQGTAVPTENWVLCRIFLKKRSNKNEHESVQLCDGVDLRRIVGHEISNSKPMFYEFLTKSNQKTDLNLAPSSSCSGSSGVTVAFRVNEIEDHEESSCFSAFPCLHKKALKL